MFGRNPAPTMLRGDVELLRDGQSRAGMVLLYNQLVTGRAVWGTEPAVSLLIPKISS